MMFRRGHKFCRALSLAVALYYPLLIGAIDWLHRCGPGPTASSCNICIEQVHAKGVTAASSVVHAADDDTNEPPGELVCVACHFGTHSKSLSCHDNVLLACYAQISESLVFEESTVVCRDIVKPILPRAPPHITTT
jgi:hypothetical protein